MNGTTTIPSFDYTAVLTSFNAQDTLSRALLGITQQEIPAAKILVVDDCSSDQSASIVKSHAQNDDRISLIVNQVNLGQSYSRNLGVSLSDSEFVIFFDDDDLSLPGRSVEHFKMFQNNAKISYVSSQIFYQNGYSKQAQNSCFSGKIVSKAMAEKLLLGMSSLDNQNFQVPASTLAVKRDSFRLIGGFDLDLRRLEDVDFAIRCASFNQVFSFSPEKLVHRFSTHSSDKGSGIDMKFEELLLNRYSENFTNSQFRSALRHCKARRLYFSKQYLALFFHFLSNPKYMTMTLLQPRRAIGRLLHDVRRLRKS